MDESDEATEGRDLQARELEIVTYLLNELRGIPQESRCRVLETVSRFFDLSGDARVRAGMTTRLADVQEPPLGVSSAPTFSEDRSVSPKQFMFQKQPQSDVEKVACLAYYLTHYRDTPYFKTLDISKLNTEAAQVKFSNPAAAVDNATKQRYLVPATKGNKQLSSNGEQFVLALPDRERARAIMSNARPRKREKKVQADS